MKKMILFKSLILASLFFSLMFMSCADSSDDNDDNEAYYLYASLPAEFNVVKDWFDDTDRKPPVPSENPNVKITTGSGTEDNISYYYEVDITNSYDVEFYLNESRGIIAVEADYLYATSLPTDIKAAVDTWFLANTEPKLAENSTKIEVTEGKMPLNKPDIGNYFYEVDIDYPTTYDIELYFDTNFTNPRFIREQL